MKAPPILPHTLFWFFAIGILFTFLASVLATFCQPYMFNQWVNFVPGYGSLGSRIFDLSLILTLGFSALWAALYLGCWPYLYFRYWSEKRAAPARKLQQALAEEAAAHAQKLRERVWMGGPPSGDIGPRPNHRPAIGESYESYRERIAEAKQAYAERLQQVEDMILEAFARYSLKSDFFGAVPQQELFRTFGANLNKLGIPDIGVLHRSTDPTIRQLVAYAPILRGQSGLYRLIKPYKKPFDPPPNPHLSGPFIKGYISGK